MTDDSCTLTSILALYMLEGYVNLCVMKGNISNEYSTTVGYLWNLVNEFVQYHSALDHTVSDN